MSYQEIFQNQSNEQLACFRSIRVNFKNSVVQFLTDNEIKILVLPHRWNAQLAAMKVGRILKNLRGELAESYGTPQTYMFIRWGALVNSLPDEVLYVPRLPNILVIELDNVHTGMKYLTSIVETVHACNRKKIVFTWSSDVTQNFEGFLNMFRTFVIYKMDIHGNITTRDASRTIHDLNIEWFNAVRSDDIGKMRDLYERSVDIINAKEIDTGNTALHIAVTGNNMEMVTMLLNQGARHLLNNTNLAPLHLAVKRGYPLVLVKLLDNNYVDKNVRGGKRNYTPLHYAVFSDEVTIISLLVEHGADLNVRSTDGFTPLHSACYKNNIESVRRLLRYREKLDINAKGRKGSQNTALHEAVRAGCFSIIKILIENGANTSIRNVNQKTPIELAPPNITHRVLTIFHETHVQRD